MTSQPAPGKKITHGNDPGFQRALERHFLTCSALAGVAAAWCAAPTGAEGAVIYSGEKDVTVPVNGKGAFIDLDTGAFSTTDEIAGFDLNFSSTGENLFFKGGANGADVANGTHTVTHSSSSSSSSSTTSYNTVSKLKGGKLINGGGALVPSGTLGRVSEASSSSSSSSSSSRHRGHSGPHHSGPWGAGGDGYVGFHFQSASNTTLFGWAHLAVGANLQTVVVDWAYDDSGQAIVAGAKTDTSVTIKVTQSSASENGAAASIHLKRTGDTSVPLHVLYKVSASSTAVSGQDYAPLSGKATIPAGKKGVTLSVSAIAHGAATGTRSLALKFLKRSGYTITTKPTSVHLAIETSD